jgi:hypothetical protein
MKSEKGQMFSIFSCGAGSRTPADSMLADYINQEGKKQVQTGVFTTLNDKLLRRSIGIAEVLP